MNLIFLALFSLENNNVQQQNLLFISGKKHKILVQGELEIPTAVTVKWNDKNAIDILRKKVEEVSYPLGEDDRYTDELKDILNLILNDDASIDSDGDVEEL